MNMDIYEIADKITPMAESEAEAHIDKIIDNDSDYLKNMAPSLASAFRCGYHVAIQNMIKEGKKCKTQ